MKKRNCFVISPIGEKDSEIRKHADSFLRLLAEPALAEFGFNIIRADQIAKSTVITNDIVEHVQQSELCLVDLTFNNPNVFYECGRRHENEKPTIQLIKEGEKLPFDVAGIRTIEYNLSDPWTTLESVNIVKDFLRNLEENDSFNDSSSGVSLTSIAQSLNRIEKKLTSPESSISYVRNEKLDIGELLTMHPGAAFNKTIGTGDIETAKFLLKRLKMLPDNSLYYQALATLSAIGDNESKNLLLSTKFDGTTRIDEKNINLIFGGLVDYYKNADAEELGLKEMDSLFKTSISNKNISNDRKSFILNRKQSLEFALGKHEQAAKTELKAIKFSPDDSSLWYNLSMNYFNTKDYEAASDAVIKWISLEEGPSPDNLEYFTDVMTKAGKESEIDKYLKPNK
jgi:tetratricopeptide (TPR) repeat protein